MLNISENMVVSGYLWRISSLFDEMVSFDRRKCPYFGGVLGMKEAETNGDMPREWSRGIFGNREKKTAG